MSYDRDQTLAVEYQRILNQAPWLKPVNGDLSHYQGKIRIQGVDVDVEIVLPDYYPVVKPIIYVNNIDHQLVRSDRTVQLAILDQWTPEKSVIDLIHGLRQELRRGNLREHVAPSVQSQTNANLRYSFPVRSSKSSVARQPSSAIRVVSDAEIKRVQNEINRLQEELRDIQSRIVREQERKLQAQGNHTAAFQVSLTDELQAKQIAINELLEILDEKFDDGDLGHVEFFRLYKIYMKEKYIVEMQLANVATTEGEKKHGISRTHEKKEQVRS